MCGVGAGGGGGGGGGGGTLTFSSYLGLGPSSTVCRQKKSVISSTPKNILNFCHAKIFSFCTFTLRKDPKMHRRDT